MRLHSKRNLVIVYVYFHLENKLINDPQFINSLLGDYSDKLEETTSKIIEEAKANNSLDPNSLIQILEDENEYLENESDEDSNSDPSEDNFSEGELEQCRN